MDSGLASNYNLIASDNPSSLLISPLTITVGAVDCEKEYLSTIPIENKEKVEQLIDAFISAENQMLEDTFVFAVKYAYELFNEIRY